MPIDKIGNVNQTVSAPQVNSKPKEQQKEAEEVDKGLSDSAKLMIGATALAATVAVGIIGHKNNWWRKAVKEGENLAEANHTQPQTMPNPIQSETLSVKQFFRDDIKFKKPEYDCKVDTNNGHKYYKDGKLVMIDMLKEGKITSVQTYTYNDLGQIVIAQEKQPNGYHCVRYLTQTEDGIRTVRYTKTKSDDLLMMIQDYNKQGQQIRLYQGSPYRNNGDLHKVEIKYGRDDKVCGFVEYFSDGTIWEMTPVPNKIYTFDINVKSGNSIKKIINATAKDISTPSGEISSVFQGSVIPTPHRKYKGSAGLVM